MKLFKYPDKDALCGNNVKLSNYQCSSVINSQNKVIRNFCKRTGHAIKRKKHEMIKLL